MRESDEWPWEGLYWEDDHPPENPDDMEVVRRWWRRDINVTATTDDGEPVL